MHRHRRHVGAQHTRCEAVVINALAVDRHPEDERWVVVLKQDTDDEHFEPDEWRKNAHGGARGQKTFAILDDLEAR